VTGADITQHAETAYDFGSIHTVHTAPTERAIADELEELPEEAEPVTRAR